jgi:hypothetical protein
MEDKIKQLEEKISKIEKEIEFLKNNNFNNKKPPQNPDDYLENKDHSIFVSD